MIEEYCVHRLTDIVIASERETQVADSSADMSTRQMLLDPARRTDEVCSIAVVLLHTCGHSQHIGVEDDIKRIHTHLFRKQFVGSLCDLNSALIACSLSLFVETHHDDCCTITFHIAGMLQKPFLAFFQRDRVDDTLALHTLQSCHNHLPV